MIKASYTRFSRLCQIKKPGQQPGLGMKINPAASYFPLVAQASSL